MNTKELMALKKSIDHSLALIGEKPTEPGFALEIHEQLIRMRDLLRQIQPELFKDE